MANPNPVNEVSSLNLGMTTSEELCTYLDHAVANEASAAAMNTPFIPKSNNGPILDLYSVNLKRLPLQTATIITGIKNSTGNVLNLKLGDWYEKEQNAFALTDYKKMNHQIKSFESFKDQDPLFARDLKQYTDIAKKYEQNKKAELKAELDKLNQPKLCPDTPGAMRSWHQNDTGYLPIRHLTEEQIAGASVKARLYHDYVVAYIGLQNKQKKKGIDEVYTGYIEYQAGGWREALQSGRVCYDYIDDIFYFTATHYQVRGIHKDKNPWWHVYMAK